MNIEKSFVMYLQNELEGITIVSIEQAVAAPYCAMLLAEAGARVIKIERPEGDFARGYDAGAKGKSSIFAWLNRGKESITLDMNNQADKLLLKKIISKSDVFLNNLTPGALDRKGFSFKSVRRINPKIINCSISGYGSRDPNNKKKAYDFLIQGEVGLCAVTGTDNNPSRVGVSITDISTGLTAFSAILRALIQSSRNGKGVDIELSMFDVMAEWMNMPLLAHRYSGGAPRRMGLSHSFIAPYGAFNTKDKKKILISIQNEREWQSFCSTVLKSDQLKNDDRLSSNLKRYENKTYLNEKILEVFRTLTKSCLIKKLERANIAYSNLNSVEDLSEHKLIRNKSVYFDGSVISIADLPITSRTKVNTNVPALNQHGQLIRKEFGI